MTEPVVLDASAVLAVILEEPGIEKVVPTLSFACISTVNRTETLYMLAKRLHLDSLDQATKLVDPLELEIIPFDREQSDIAAYIHMESRNTGLSIGDCACLSLAKTKSLPVLTSDKAWQKLTNLGVQVQLIR